MADQTDVIELEIFQWNGKSTARADAGATTLAHSTALPSGITGNFTVSVTNPDGTVARAYCPAGAASDTQLGTAGSPLRWLLSTGSDLVGSPSNGIVIKPGAIIRSNSENILFWMFLHALRGNIGSSQKLNSAPSFSGSGIGKARVFATTAARDIAIPSPVEGNYCEVTGTGLQYYNGGSWMTLGTSTTAISSWKEDVACATTGNITLSGEQTIDGILTSTSRVLVKDQTLPEENGLWASDAGAWTRTDDFDAPTEVDGAAVVVNAGTTNADSIWICTTNNPTIGTDPISFSKLNIDPYANQVEAEAGAATDKSMNPLRTRQAIDAVVKTTLLAGEDFAAGEVGYLDSFAEFADSQDADRLFGKFNLVMKVGIQIVGNGTSVSSLKLALSKVGLPTDDVQIRVETDNAGEPSGTLAHADAYAAIAGGTLTTSYTDETATFNGAFTLTDKTRYWVVLQRSTDTADAANYYQLGILAANTTRVNSFANYNKNTTSWGSLETENLYLSFAGAYNGLWALADASQTATCEGQLLMANEVISARAEGKLNYPGSLDKNQTGLTVNADYYLSDTPGAIASTQGTIKRKVGEAIDANQLLLVSEVDFSDVLSTKTEDRFFSYIMHFYWHTGYVGWDASGINAPSQNYNEGGGGVTNISTSGAGWLVSLMTATSSSSGYFWDAGDGTKISLKWILTYVADTGVQGQGLCPVGTPSDIYDSVSGNDDSVRFAINTSEELYAVTANGSANTNTQITGVTVTSPHTYQIIFNPGVNAKFYVDGVLRATHTTNLPTTVNAFATGCSVAAGWYTSPVIVTLEI